MSEQEERIDRLLAEGKISAEEAERLRRALDKADAAEGTELRAPESVKPAPVSEESGIWKTIFGVLFFISLHSMLLSFFLGLRSYPGDVPPPPGTLWDQLLFLALVFSVLIYFGSLLWAALVLRKWGWALLAFLLTFTYIVPLVCGILILSRKQVQQDAKAARTRWQALMVVSVVVIVSALVMSSVVERVQRTKLEACITSHPNLERSELRAMAYFIQTALVGAVACYAVALSALVGLVAGVIGYRRAKRRIDISSVPAGN